MKNDRSRPYEGFHLIETLPLATQGWALREDHEGAQNSQVLCGLFLHAVLGEHQQTALLERLRLTCTYAPRQSV